MSTLYEVTLQIESALIEQYDLWLSEHVNEMLTLPGFERAEVFAIEPDSNAPDPIFRVVHYWLEDRQAFDNYLRDHAKSMRGDGLRRFGNRATASRRILQPID